MKNNLKLIILLCIETKIDGSFNNFKKIFLSNKDLEKNLEENIIKNLFKFFKNEGLYIYYKNTNTCYIDKNNQLKFQKVIDGHYWLARGYSTFLLFEDERDLIPKDFFPKFDYIENIKKKNTIEIGCKNVDIILKKLNKIKNTIKNNDNLSIKMKNLISSWEEYKEEIGNLVDKNELRKKEKEKEKYKEI